jgi:hypothetical protein
LLRQSTSRATLYALAPDCPHLPVSNLFRLAGSIPGRGRPGLLVQAFVNGSEGVPMRSGLIGNHVAIPIAWRLVGT